MGYIKVLHILNLVFWNMILYLKSKCVLCSFIHVLIIPQSITGTEPIDMELITYIVQYMFISSIYM